VIEATEKRMSTSAAENFEEARERARKSSFYRAMAILPREKRDAMFEIYSFCRAVDDIADEGGDRPTRLAGLNRWRRDIDALYAGGAPGLAAGLVEPLRHFGFHRDDFHAVIDGMQMDVDADIVAPDTALLDLYCDRVASAVGRLSVRVFGMEVKQGIALAHHLGRALQLTNILRDIDEDAHIGRLYLPRESLFAAGIKNPTPDSVAAMDDLDAVCAPIMAQAKQHFEAADAIMATQKRDSIRAPKIMAIAYSAIWRRLAARGFKRPRAKIRTPRLVLLGAILSYGIF
jgi:phytoene synthase